MIDLLKHKVKSLPPLPESLIEIKKACDDDKVGIDGIARAIEKDPMLVADLLKIANSPLYGFNRRIKTVLQVVGLFGRNTIKTLVLSSAINSILKIDMAAYDISLEQFVNLCTTQAVIAKKWFERANKVIIDDIFFSALLQHTGKIVMADIINKQDKVDEFKNLIKQVGVQQAEVEFFGTTSTLLTAEIFDHWHFDPSIIECIRCSNVPKETSDGRRHMAYALYILRVIVDFAEPFSKNNIAHGLEIVQEAGLDPDLLKECIGYIN